MLYDNFNESDLIFEADANHALFNVMLEIQSKCNWRCKHCYVDDYSKQLSTNDILDLLPKLRSLGCFEITLTGGEIFMRDDLIEIIGAIRNQGFKLVLFSNASLLDESIISFLANVNIALLSCTIFSLDESVHDAITGVKGSLQKVKSNVILSNRYGIPIEIKTMLTKMNSGELDSLKSFCNENKFLFKPDFAVYSKLNGDCNNQNIMLSEEKIVSVIKAADEIVGYSVAPGDRSDDLVCPQLLHSLSIDWHGNIHPCNRLSTIIGNIKNDDIIDIWLNSKILRSISSVRWRDLPQCIDCDNISYCVRCAGGALDETGDILSKSKVACRIACARKYAYQIP